MLMTTQNVIGADTARKISTRDQAAPGPTASVRIVIAASHPMLRDGLRWLLESEPRLLVVADIGDTSQAAALVRDRRADILLLDFSSGRQAALDTLQEIAASGTCVRTIILGDSVDMPGLLEAWQLGSRGLVLKDSAAEMLFQGIQSIMAGHYWIDRDRVADGPGSLHRLTRKSRRQKPFGLTRRELQVIRAVVAGSTNGEIAQSLTIRENTVKSHLTHIFDKLGASTRVELALFAAHHGLLHDRHLQ